jgi:hypothetical protein
MPYFRKEAVMTDLVTLRQQVPFELIPTNIPNVYTLPTPPEGIDPHTASSKILRKHGLLLRRPSPSDHPALQQAWQKVFYTSGGSMIEFFHGCSRNSERHII